MQLNFVKFQGTGNDFVIIDQIMGVEQSFSSHQVASICDRRFGIGADGLIIIRKHPKLDFQMVYFNSDGNESSMCGNGGRCIVKFAFEQGYIGSTCSFEAIDGKHRAEVQDDKVALEMRDVAHIELDGGDCILNTGSPHFVRFEKGLSSLDILNKARIIRYSDRFSSEGINVNFVQFEDDKLSIRTYERGVENETLSCGTGVTAAVIASHKKGLIHESPQSINTVGGQLEVSYEKMSESYINIWLKGPAERVFEGSYLLK